MAEKKSKKTEETNEVQVPLEQLVLNRQFGKYQIVDRISTWAKELRKLEEHRHLTQTEILDLAMADVLSGKVDEAEMDKKAIANHAAAGSAKKDPEKKSSKKS